MPAAAMSSRSGRRLNASGRARRARHASVQRRRTILMGAAAFALVVGAPFGIVARMGMLDEGLPGLDSAKSFLAMMTDRSPGERTKAELTKTKSTTLAMAAPKMRALPKVAKPELPKEFVAAIAPPLPGIAEIPATAPLTSIGPLLLTPGIPGGGGGIFVPPQGPPGGGGGPPAPPPATPRGSPPPVDTPSVPEPGTWATMLLGFGLTGWTMRRRRRTLAASIPG
jgi:hypothetical protein